jgi:hypothetical protein
MLLSWVGEEIETVALPRLSTTDQPPCLGDQEKTNEPDHASFDLSVRFRTALVPTPDRLAKPLAGDGSLMTNLQAVSEYSVAEEAAGSLVKAYTEAQ